MSQDIRQGKKRFKKHWVILLFFIVGAVIFHQPILLAGCKFVLNTIIPKSQGRTVGYKTMQWEEKAIAISGLEIKDLSSELKIDRIELRLKWDFLHFCFKPEMTVLHPQITFAANASNSAPFLPFLYRTNWFQPRWEIKDGVIRLPSQTCFYFSLSAKQDPSSIGNLLFSYDPNPLISPMISADLSTREDLLQVGLELRTTSLKKLLPITALIVPEISREWEKADGDVEFTGLICFSKAYQIQELHCHGSGKSIDLRGPVMGIDVRAEEVRGNFSYPVAETSGSFWDQLSATVLLKKGFCLLQAPIIKQPVGMDGLEGELKFQPKEEPTLTLKGALIKEDQRMPFDLQGKGRVQEDHTFWSELEFNGNSLHGYHMQAFLSLCSDQAKDITLHAKVENAAFEHLDFLRAFSAIPGRCVEGKANLEATLVYAGGKWQKTSIEKCLMENIRWYFPEKQMTAYADQITTIGSLEKNEDVWNLADLHLQLNAGDYLDPHMHIEDFTSIVVVDKGILQSAECKGSWGELKAGIAFVNAEDGPCTQCDLKGDAKELLSFFSKAQFPKSVLIDMHAQAKFDKGNLRITTDATVAKEPIKASALLNYSPICSSEILLGKLPKFTFKEGQFQADALTAQSYDAFFAVLFPDLNLEGKLQCKATFSPTSIQIQAGGEQLVLKHLWATLFLPQLKEKNAQFSYDVTQKQWRGEIPLKEAALEYRSLGLPFTNIEGALKLEGNHLRSNAFYAECEGLALRGNLDLSFENGQIALSTSQVAGDAKSLFAVLNHFPALSKIDLPIMGDFSSADKGFVLNAGMGKDAADWSFKGSFANLHFPLNSATSITDGHCEVQFDSKTNRLVLEKAEGVWKLKDGMPMTVQLKRFSLHAEEGVDFAVKVVDGKREFAHFEGRANKTAKSL
jgi:hypothetical protein